MQSANDDATALAKAKTLISEGHTLLIAIDSNAFFEGTDSNRRVSFNQNWMGIFRGLAARGETLLMSSVWDVEVKRHFSRSIDSQVEIRLPKFAKTKFNSSKIDDLNRRASVLSQDAKKLVEQEWDSVKDSLNAKIITVPNEPELACKIFNLWANNTWPFEKRKQKRDEFQDAFALLSLLTYVEELRRQSNSEKASILVVTADAGCREFCAQTEALIPCSNVDAAISLLSNRQEILRLVQRGIELGATFEDSNHVIYEHLRQDFLRSQQSAFPPPAFSYVLNGEEITGWLRSLEIKSISLLPVGPDGRKIDLTYDQDESISFDGRVKIELLISLNEPGYTIGTACPSNKAICSDLACSLDIAFHADFSSGYWQARLTETSRKLEPIVTEK